MCANQHSERLAGPLWAGWVEGNVLVVPIKGIFEW